MIKGLMGMQAPNMNAFRDPRWGRGQETPGEDIYHVQNYIKNYVPGMQGPDVDQKQIIATCKHYASVYWRVELRTWS